MKRKLQRYAEIETLPNVFQEDVPHRHAWHPYFGNEHPIILELGCGRGEYTIELARQRPEANFIGIDIKGARLWRGAKTAFEEEMNHVAFLRIQIESLSEFFAPEEVSEIWITFPDPQPSQRRMKKRLTYARFLNYYKALLKPGGLLHLKTDNLGFFEYSLESIPASGGKILTSNSDIYHLPDEGAETSTSVRETQTSYEKRYIREGKNICYLLATFPTVEPVSAE